MGQKSETWCGCVSPTRTSHEAATKLLVEATDTSGLDGGGLASKLTPVTMVMSLVLTGFWMEMVPFHVGLFMRH